ncbi:MAG: alanine racemase [Alphaproteobacteria bacterium]
MSAEIRIDLDALKANWTYLNQLTNKANCAAAVKANAYGLGLAPITHALHDAGCDTFFVALAEEGIALKKLLPEATIYVLNGPDEKLTLKLTETGLYPVLNSLDQVLRWKTHLSPKQSSECALHLDTGMARLGLSATEIGQLADEPTLIDGLNIKLVMSHLADADRPQDQMAEQQRQRFDAARTKLNLQHLPASLANSAGIFHGEKFHYNMVRPGLALYGGAPLQTMGQTEPNPMQPVVTVRAQIIQTRVVEKGDPIGYGAAFRATDKSLIATCAIGYADGYPRALSHQGVACLEDQKVPVVGRISMDLTTLDVSNIPNAKAGDWVTFLGGPISIDDVAAKAGTATYELLTGLSSRIPRIYEGAH